MFGGFGIKEEFPRIDSSLFPHNEHGETVEKKLIEDTKESSTLRVVSGYAGLDIIVSYLTKHALHCDSIKLMFGDEPAEVALRRFSRTKKNLDQEIRDYWLNRGISVTEMTAVHTAIELLKSDRIEVMSNAHSTKSRLHAKLFITDTKVIHGSSNFTKPGLRKSRELNSRFDSRADSVRFRECEDFFEGCWNDGDDYKQKLIELLEKLLQSVTWQEALARACAEVLEGFWAESFLRGADTGNLNDLWPHQLQGIAQCLWVMENVGSVLVADATGSGKTLMGAWLLRAAFNRQIACQNYQRDFLSPVAVVPSGVERHWQSAFRKAGITVEIVPSVPTHIRATTKPLILTIPERYHCDTDPRVIGCC
jgi:HKD family nuclease